MNVGGASSSGFDYSAHRAEMKAQMDAKFAKVDTDSSGGISFEEFSVERTENAQDSAKVADTRSLEEQFSELDADGDGQLTATDRENRPPPPPPPPPGGNFTTEALSGLLAIQEDSSGGSSVSDLLASSYSSEESTESSLIDTLLESLTTEEDA